MKKFLTIFALCIITVSTMYSQTEEKKADDWKFSGQFQLRSELDGRDFNNLTHPYNFNVSRIRFGVEKTLFKDVTGFIQIQDSRTWGEEKATIASIKNLDLHQGYITINNIFNQPIYTQVGRFKMKYGSERWISYNEFNNVARSFDGIRAGYKDEMFKIDLFWTLQNPAYSYVSKAIPKQYPGDAILDTAFYVSGLFAQINLNKENSFDLLFFNENDGRKNNKLFETNLNRFTGGFSYNLKLANFSLLTEFAYQFGTMAETTIKDKDTVCLKKDIAAYNLGIEANYTFDPFTIGILVDMFSGTKYDENEKFNTFTRSLGGNHKFHGIMDYFADMQAGTANRGVNDFSLIFAYKEKDKPFSAQADFHYFMTNVPYLIYLRDENGAKTGNTEENSNLGQEIDLRFRYQVVKNAQLELGTCAFIPSDVMKDIYYIAPNTTSTPATPQYKREDISFWMYLQLKVDL